MYVCMYYVCMHIYVCSYVHIYNYVCTNVCRYLGIQIRMYLYIWKQNVFEQKLHTPHYITRQVSIELNCLGFKGTAGFRIFMYV